MVIMCAMTSDMLVLLVTLIAVLLFFNILFFLIIHESNQVVKVPVTEIVVRPVPGVTIKDNDNDTENALYHKVKFHFEKPVGFKVSRLLVTDGYTENTEKARRLLEESVYKIYTYDSAHHVEIVCLNPFSVKGVENLASKFVVELKRST
jgi:hypothetical protein